MIGATTKEESKDGDAQLPSERAQAIAASSLARPCCHACDGKGTSVFNADQHCTNRDVYTWPLPWGPKTCWARVPVTQRHLTNHFSSA
nr:unnamed protein product [Digitaria exilis]